MTDLKSDLILFLEQLSNIKSIEKIIGELHREFKTKEDYLKLLKKLQTFKLTSKQLTDFTFYMMDLNTSRFIDYSDILKRLDSHTEDLGWGANIIKNIYKELPTSEKPITFPFLVY